MACKAIFSQCAETSIIYINIQVVTSSYTLNPDSGLPLELKIFLEAGAKNGTMLTFCHCLLNLELFCACQDSAK